MSSWAETISKQAAKADPAKLDAYRAENDYPMEGVNFIRVGAAFLLSEDEMRRQAGHYTLARLALMINMPYDPRPERHRVVDKHTLQETVVEPSALIPTDKMNLKDICLLLYIMSYGADAQVRYAYATLMGNRVEKMLKDVEEKGRFNPKDYGSIMLARADAMPRGELRQWMVDKFDFGEDKVVCSYRMAGAPKL